MDTRFDNRPRTAAAAADASDKHFWHRFTAFYEDKFKDIGSVNAIFEFGIYHGASVRWLRERFPQAKIIGVDILPTQPDWPIDDRIFYYQIDQGIRSDIRDLFQRIDTVFDLIIEDGSHIPQHQASCLDISLEYLRPGGLYILEDIHTSHPQQKDFARFSITDGKRVPNALNILLALQHRKNIGKPIKFEDAQAMSAPDFLGAQQIMNIQQRIDSLELFKRTELPLRCWQCGSDQFDYTTWQCQCGTDLYAAADSMSFAIWRM